MGVDILLKSCEEGRVDEQNITDEFFFALNLTNLILEVQAIFSLLSIYLNLPEQNTDDFEVQV